MNKEEIQEWANTNALLMDSMDSYGTPIDYKRKLELQKLYEEYDGQFTEKEDILSFVIGNHQYATPLVEEAQEVLNKNGFEKTNNVPVPLVAIGSFPGILSIEMETSLWFDSDGQAVMNPAERILEYYYEVIVSYPSYLKWVELLKKNGSYKKEKDPVLYNVKLIKEQMDCYNNYANDQIEKILEKTEEKILIK